MDKPGHMFNMDKSGMSLDCKAPRVVGEWGSSAITVGSGNKSQATIVGCCSAAGFCMPPRAIWDCKSLAPKLTIGDVPGTIYGLSRNGCMDMELFHIWFSNHFLRYAPSVRPLLLLLGGHLSHYCPDTIRLAAHKRVVLYALPPNTTHVLAPWQGVLWAPKNVLEGGMPSVHDRQSREGGDKVSVFSDFQQGMDHEHDGGQHHHWI